MLKPQGYRQVNGLTMIAKGEAQVFGDLANPREAVSGIDTRRDDHQYLVVIAACDLTQQRVAGRPGECERDALKINPYPPTICVCQRLGINQQAIGNVHAGPRMPGNTLDQLA